MSVLPGDEAEGQVEKGRGCEGNYPQSLLWLQVRGERELRGRRGWGRLWRTEHQHTPALGCLWYPAQWLLLSP